MIGNDVERKLIESEKFKSQKNWKKIEDNRNSKKIKVIRQSPYDKELINECMNEWETLQMNNWLTEFERTKKASERTNECTNQQTIERANDRTDEYTVDGWPTSTLNLNLVYNLVDGDYRLTRLLWILIEQHMTLVQLPCSCLFQGFIVMRYVEKCM